MIYCCEEHVELALDETVDQHELAPKLEKVVDNNNFSCGYCGKQAVYIVGNE